MGSSRNWLNRQLFAVLPRDAAVCVGFSGGVDSAVLLDLFAQEAKLSRRELSAVHVHHGLSPNAGRWAAACERFCAERDIPLDVVRVKVDRRAKEGLEAAARAARYAVYARRPEPYVALAHHLDDQAETVLLQLLRGTGLKGVGGMPILRELPGSGVAIYRPLLVTSRDDILEYARAMRLEWIEDESNASVAHDRNYIRHEVAPLLDARFPAWRRSLARFANQAAVAQGMLASQAGRDGADGRATLPLDPGLSLERRANVLRGFLETHELAMPSQARLSEMLRQLYGARADARVRIDHDGATLVRHRGEVHVHRTTAAGSDWRIAWKGERSVDLGHGRGEVQFRAAKGKGIDAAIAREGEWWLMPRAGGEKMRVSAKGRTRTLKNLLQEHAIPAWRRENLPLLFRGDDLVWAPGVGIAAEFACRSRRPGISPCLKVAGEPALC